MYQPNHSLKLISVLTGLLATASASPTPVTTTQAAQLAEWVERVYPKLTADLSGLTSDNYLAFFQLVEDARTEAQALKGILVGLDRAQVAAAVIRFVAEELPADVQAWAAPLLSAGVLENLLEGSYRTVFGQAAPVDLPAEVHTETPPPATVDAAARTPQEAAPVTNDPTLPSGVAQ